MLARRPPTSKTQSLLRTPRAVRRQTMFPAKAVPRTKQSEPLSCYRLLSCYVFLVARLVGTAELFAAYERAQQDGEGEEVLRALRRLSPHAAKLLMAWLQGKRPTATVNIPRPMRTVVGILGVSSGRERPHSWRKRAFFDFSRSPENGIVLLALDRPRKSHCLTLLNHLRVHSPPLAAQKGIGPTMIRRCLSAGSFIADQFNKMTDNVYGKDSRGDRVGVS